MLETAETGHTLRKSVYQAREPALRVDLINAQYDLRKAAFPVILLIAGNDRLGGNELLNLMHEWLDARYIETEVMGYPTEEELQRPPMWRYWRALPPKGRLGIFLGAWTLNTVAGRALKRLDKAAFAKRIEHICHFEKALVDDGALVLKFWLHLPRRQLKKRLSHAAEDPRALLRPEDIDWKIYQAYDKSIPVIEHFLRLTATDHAPWHLVESTDARYRNLTVMETVLASLQARLDAAAGSTVPPECRHTTPLLAVHDGGNSVLDQVDLGAGLEKDAYKRQLRSWQRRFNELVSRARERDKSAVLVFEGWDAAGKGGAIRRLTSAMAARDYRVVRIGAPNEEEKAHHYLWRFWRLMPRAGRMIIFDRSWYGRVLVERIEGLATREEWMRAYDEINDFEDELLNFGIPVIKFWLHVDAAEQLRRFEERLRTPYKKYKLTTEDIRNRTRRDDYTRAVNDMVTYTSTPEAPWHLVAANNKRHARVAILKTTCAVLEKIL